MIHKCGVKVGPPCLGVFFLGVFFLSAQQEASTGRHLKSLSFDEKFPEPKGAFYKKGVLDTNFL